MRFPSGERGGAPAGRKLISVLSKRQIMLLIDMFVVNGGPVRRHLFMKKHAFGRLGGGAIVPLHPLWIRPCTNYDQQYATTTFCFINP